MSHNILFKRNIYFAIDYCNKFDGTTHFDLHQE